MLACRPMLPLAFAVAAGALAARRFPSLPEHAGAGAGLFALALAWFFLRRGDARRPDLFTVPADAPQRNLSLLLPSPGCIARRGLNRFFLILCIGCFFLAAWRQGERHARLDPARLPPLQWVNAVLVADAPNRSHAGAAGRWNVPARITMIDENPVDGGGLPVRLYGSMEASFRRGDLIRARVRLSGPRPQAFPGAFDSGFWLERDSLAAYANAARGRNPGEYAFAVLPVDAPSALLRLRRVIDDVRAAAVGRTLALGGAQGPMLAAMIYGYRDALDGGLNSAFRRVGIGHVLAISGLHVGLVIGLLWWLSGWLPWSGRGRSLACLLAALVYLGLSGAQVAAARATLMAVIHLGARVAGRRSDMLNSLGAAAFLIILLNPTAPLDVGFQLSFTAVVFIYGALGGGRGTETETPPPQAAPLLLRLLLRQLGQLARLSIAVWTGLFPIVAAVFHQVNPAGLPLNIVVIPLMGAVLAGGLLLPALGWIPGAAAVLTAPAEALTRIAFAVDALPYSSFPAHSPSGWWMAAFYACVFCFLLRRMLDEPARRRLWSRVCAAGIAISLAGTAASMRSSPPPAESRLSLLPGSGLGVIAAETPDGSIALVGQIRRQGLDEAAWLHHLRRGGRVSLVTLGRGRNDTLEGLAFHYPPAAQVNLPLTAGREADARPAWRPVPEAPGIDFALVRNSRGRATALVVRAGGKMLASESGLGESDAAALDAFLRENGASRGGGAIRP